MTPKLSRAIADVAAASMQTLGTVPFNATH